MACDDDLLLGAEIACQALRRNLAFLPWTVGSRGLRLIRRSHLRRCGECRGELGLVSVAIWAERRTRVPGDMIVCRATFGRAKHVKGPSSVWHQLTRHRFVLAGMLRSGSASLGCRLHARRMTVRLWCSSRSRRSGPRSSHRKVGGRRLRGLRSVVNSYLEQRREIVIVGRARHRRHL